MSRILNHLEKAIFTNYIQREILNREIPGTCTLKISAVLSGGKCKSLEIVPVGKEKKSTKKEG